MKIKLSRVLLVAVLVISGIISNHCSEDPPIVQVQSVYVVPTGKPIIAIDGEIQLNKTVKPDNATDASVAWISSDPTVATVDENGLVKGIGGGTANIKASAGAHSSSCRITVLFPPLVITPATKTMVVKDIYNLKATVAGHDESKKLAFATSDAKVATIDDNGIVTAIGAGQTIITVVSADNQSATCTVIVSSGEILVSAIASDADTQAKAKSIKKGDPSTSLIDLCNITTNADATNKKLNFRSENPNIASIDTDGYITGVTKGITKIFVNAVFGKPNLAPIICYINVIEDAIPVTGIKVSPLPITLKLGETIELPKYTVEPANANNKEVTFSKVGDLISINATAGTLTGEKVGEATLTVTSVGNTAVFSTYTVKVVNPVTAVTLTPVSVSLEKDKTTTLTPTLYPIDAAGATLATNKKVSYLTSDKDIVDITATTDTNCTIKGKAVGTARITVVSEDGNKTAFCDVTVTGPIVAVTGITVTPTDIKLPVDGTQRLIVGVLPADATNKAVTYSIEFEKTEDENSVFVDNFGYVNGIAKTTGYVKITVTSVDKPGLAAASKTIPVSVIDAAIPVTGVSLSDTKITLDTGTNTSKNIEATITPALPTIDGLTFESNNTAIVTAEVIVGQPTRRAITAKAPGTARITVTTVDGGKTAYCDVTVTEPVTGIAGVPTTLWTLGKDETRRINASVLPVGATNKGLTYTSSDEAKVRVDNYGYVTGMNVTNTNVKITVSSVEDPSIKGEFDVKVNPTGTAVTGITVTPNPFTLNKDETKRLTVVVSPPDATNKGVSFSSSNNTNVTVDNYGYVTGNVAGNPSATITVTALDGSGFSHTFPVEVKDYTPVTGVSLVDKHVILGTTAISSSSPPLLKTQTITATVTPGTPTNQTVTYSSSNNGVATVATNGLDGEITAVASGTARITVTTADGGKTDYCDVTVVKPVTGITVTPTNMPLKKGATQRLSIVVSPSDATNKSVSFNGSNTKVTVDSYGYVTGEDVTTSDVPITVTALDGYGASGTCNVTVTNPAVPVTGVSVYPASITLKTGDLPTTLIPTVYPSDATDQRVSYSSSNNIVSVNGGGDITAGTIAGTARIIVTTTDGGKKAYCDVTVTKPVTDITIPSTMELKKGATSRLGVAVVPSDASNKRVNYKSSDDNYVTVDKYGYVTGVNITLASPSPPVTITVSSADDPTVISNTCTVTVIDANVPVTGVSVSPSSITLKTGDSDHPQLIPTVYPSDASDKGVIFSTTASASIATVDPNTGVITAGGTAGTARITVTTNDGNKKAYCDVTVTNAVPVTAVTLNKVNITLGIGAYVTIDTVVYPGGATNKAVKYYSSDQSIVIVTTETATYCKIRGATTGTARITVVTDDGGKTAYCDVTVTP